MPWGGGIKPNQTVLHFLLCHLYSSCLFCPLHENANIESLALLVCVYVFFFILHSIFLCSSISITVSRFSLCFTRKYKRVCGKYFIRCFFLWTAIMLEHFICHNKLVVDWLCGSLCVHRNVFVYIYAHVCAAMVWCAAQKCVCVVNQNDKLFIFQHLKKTNWKGPSFWYDHFG